MNKLDKIYVKVIERNTNKVICIMNTEEFTEVIGLPKSTFASKAVEEYNKCNKENYASLEIRNF